MDKTQLQCRIRELENYLTDFGKIQDNSKQTFQSTLDLITDCKQRSSFMEKHLTYLERQKKSIAKMQRMYEEALNQLANLEEPDL